MEKKILLTTQTQPFSNDARKLVTDINKQAPKGFEFPLVEVLLSSGQGAVQIGFKQKFGSTIDSKTVFKITPGTESNILALDFKNARSLDFYIMQDDYEITYKDGVLTYLKWI